MRSSLRIVGAMLLAGVLLGIIWRLMVRPLAERAGLGEQYVTIDGSFFVLGVLAGVITAVVVLRSAGSGRAEVSTLLVVLVGATAASALAVAVSALTGGPVLIAWAGLLAWPWTCAMLVATVSAIRLLGRDPY